MAEIDNKFDKDEYQRLVNLGKRGQLFTIEVTYTLDKEVKQLRRRNMEGSSVKSFRKLVCVEGITLIKGPGHWVVILPMDVHKIEIYQQNGYFSG